MSSNRLLRTLPILLGFCAGLLAFPVKADVVTYTWTTTNEGIGMNLGSPTASFEVDSSVVASGIISMSDITDIQMSYPGLSFDALTVSSGGLDAAAYVDPTTGAFIDHADGQGLSLFGYDGSIFDYTTDLSITIDDNNSSVGSGVHDQFSATDDGSADSGGTKTAGYWTASFASDTGTPGNGANGDPGNGVPEPGSVALVGLGLAAAAVVCRRNRI